MSEVRIFHKFSIRCGGPAGFPEGLQFSLGKNSRTICETPPFEKSYLDKKDGGHRPVIHRPVILVTVFSRRPRIARGTGRRGDSQGSDGALVFREKPKI